MLRIHNTLTGQKEAVRPIVPGQLGMYICGITVYDYCHVGHGRMNVVFDMVHRYLLHCGYRVNFVRNITDIDDKIIRRAAENNETIAALTARFIKAMDEDFAALGILKPDHEPRATQYMAGIVAMIAKLIHRGHAYVATDGDVMYSVESFDGYGKLSGKKIEDLRSGARVEVDHSKRDPLDFVLWKRAKPGEPSWDSPWGKGRPGWHIECSAMSTAVLGNHFDIHGGGMDLKFPHHENEIAQSCGATGEQFANLWMHNGFVNVDDEKMSKSLNNFFTLREVLAKLRHPEVMRLFLLSSHYRGPINYALEPLEQADATLCRLYTALRGLSIPVHAPITAHTEKFEAAMDDDFNTAEAIGVLQSLAREINTARAAGHLEEAGELAAELEKLGGILGLLGQDAEQWFKFSGGIFAANPCADSTISAQLSEAEIEAQIAARLAARAAKNFVESDRIRKQLVDAGVLLEDQPGNRTTWRRS